MPVGRADTHEKKLAVVIRLYHAWCARPQLRLGQMLLNAASEPVLYNIEDDGLITLVEVDAVRADGKRS